MYDTYTLLVNCEGFLEQLFEGKTVGDLDT